MATTIRLPPPNQKGEMSLEEAIAKRRSIRDFTSAPVLKMELSQILWAAQGITDTSSKSRSVPSAGATYPLEIFVVCGENCVEGVDAGIYQYDIFSHSLSLRHEGDARMELAKVALFQHSILEAPFSIVICSVSVRTTYSYGSRGERYVYIEVGHAGQNIYLQATALGLGTVAIGAFRDEQVREVLKLERDYIPIYIMPVGRPR